MHVMAGFILSITFQLAHVVDKAEFPTEEEVKQSSILEHQLKTTANFATKNWLVTWYTGGLNFQVEHHLFPTINPFVLVPSMRNSKFDGKALSVM